jgi:hypothetical protein
MAPNKRIIRLTGYIILIVSCILFLLIPVVPFLGFKAAKAAAVSTGLLIAGEILFYLSIFILGKSFLEKIRSWFRSKKKNISEATISGTHQKTSDYAKTQGGDFS